jgi:hypothetical protein
MLDEDFQHDPSSSRRVSSQGWGLAGLLIGCSLVVAGPIMMVFGVLLEERRLGFPLGLALLATGLAMGVVALLGVLGMVCGLRGWNRSIAQNESTSLGVAGTWASLIGLLVWLAPTIYVIVVLCQNAR